MHNFTGRQQQDGVVLLMVLWAIVVLTALMFTFAFMTRTDALSTFSYKESITRDYLAEAGISRAVMEMFYFNLKQEDELLVDYESLWKPDGTVYEGEIPSGKYQVRISDESGKININVDQSYSLLHNLLLNFEVEEEQIETIIDSIKDWRDADDLHQLNGAESDYYESLTPPYKAKNANFDTIEELLWVKGVTKELFYGAGDGKALKDYITVYGSGEGRIKLFTASREVLLAIPGMTEARADEIIADRSTSNPDFDTEGLDEEYFIDDNDMSESIYTIEAVGVTSHKIPEYGVRAVVMISSYDEYRFINWRFRSPVSIKTALAEDKNSNDIEGQDDEAEDTF